METNSPTDVPDPEIGEMRKLNGLSWEPWVIVTRVEEDDDGNRLARFAVTDTLDGDDLNTVPDATFVLLEESIGNRIERREAAEAIDARDDIDKRWCPVERLDVLGEPGIQGCRQPDTTLSES